MNRGLRRKDIFYTPTDREVFLSLLKDINEKFHVQIHAYCLMSNHYHLLLHTPLPNLQKAMRHLGGVYTQRFNRDHNKDDPLFTDG
ncbi:MAG: transposase [Pseudomonadota bacterium]|nr:transposase [Pseudomonadota bacterium]